MEAAKHKWQVEWWEQLIKETQFFVACAEKKKVVPFKDV